MSRRNRLTSPNRSNRSYKRRNLAVQRRPRPMAPEEGPGVVAGSTLDRGRGEGRHGPGQYRLISNALFAARSDSRTGRWAAMAACSSSIAFRRVVTVGSGSRRSNSSRRSADRSRRRRGRQRSRRRPSGLRRRGDDNGIGHVISRVHKVSS